MPSTQELLEQRANIWEQMKGINETADRENRDLTAEEQQKWDQADSALDDLDVKVERQKKYENRDKQFSTVDRTEIVKQADSDARGDSDAETKAYATAFASYLRGGLTSLEAREAKILQSGFVDTKEIRNAAGVGTGGAGGYTVPQLFRDVLIETMKYFSGVRQVADHIDTATGATLPWPTVDDTGNVGAILAENTAVTEQDFTFGTEQLGAYMYTSKLVRVSLQLLNDSAFNLDAWLPRKLGERIGRINNQHFTTGTGSSQPTGIVTAAAVGKQGATGQTTTVIYDDLVDLIDSVDAAYLGAGNIGWMFSQSVRRNIRKIKDLQNRPLWEPSLQAGVPDSLLGYGITLNNDMPAPAASAKTVLFGNFRAGYIVRDVNDVQVLRLSERYAEYLQVGFLAFHRSDATAQDTNAYKAYQQSAT